MSEACWECGKKWDIQRGRCVSCWKVAIEEYLEKNKVNFEEAIEITEKNQTQGKKWIDIAAAVIYLVAKRDCIGLPLKDIADFFGVTKTRVITRIARNITIENMGCPITTPDLILQRLGDPDDKKMLLEFYYIIEKEANLTGKAPSTIAAAVEYMFYKCFTPKRRYQHHIVAKHGVTEVAIRNCCREIQKSPYYQRRLLSLAKEKARPPIHYRDVFRRCGYEPPECPFCGKRSRSDYGWGTHIFTCHGEVELVRKVREIGDITAKTGRYIGNEERRNKVIDSWLKDVGVLE